MENLSAESVNDLLKALAAEDISVPLRTEGRTTGHCERSSICRFLAAYAGNELFEFPLELTKRERPDYHLRFPSRSVGIEVTEAVPRNWARALSRQEKLDGDDAIFIQSFVPGEALRSKEEIDNIARGAAPGDGWTGDAPERQWADAMMYFSEEKSKKFEKAGFERFEHNWLLIYDNWPLPMVNRPKAASYLLERLQVMSAPFPFDSIFVESDQSIWQFRPSEWKEQVIRDVWQSANK